MGKMKITGMSVEMSIAHDRSNITRDGHGQGMLFQPVPRGEYKG